jgi:hypothetical protein
MKITNKNFLTFAGILFACLAITACKKTVVTADYREGAVFMPQSYGTNGDISSSLLIVDTPQTVVFGAAYGGVGYPGHDITVNFKIDSGAVAAYNAKNNTNDILLPASSYQVPSLTGVIKAGQTASTLLKLLITTVNLSNNATYVLPITLTGVYGGGFLDSSAVTTYFTVTPANLVNVYDGNYNVTGTMVDYSNGTLTGSYPLSVNLITSGATQVQFYDNTVPGFYHSILSGGSGSYYGSFCPVFNFDANNNVISVVNYYGQPSSNGRSATLDPSGVNHWDPATKTLKVTYWMDQPSVITPHRVSFDETFTYVGHR